MIQVARLPGKRGASCVGRRRSRAAGRGSRGRSAQGAQRLMPAPDREYSPGRFPAGPPAAHTLCPRQTPSAGKGVPLKPLPCSVKARRAVGRSDLPGRTRTGRPAWKRARSPGGVGGGGLGGEWGAARAIAPLPTYPPGQQCYPTGNRDDW